jgi:hypothetical protein
MKIYRYALFGLIAGVSALAVSSCAYDPYYSGSSSYGGYGDGYGYGGSNFSTSLFVSTGNSRWAYDPYAGAYYDYTRRAYYDPYLYGYYPVGYRPRYVYGSPHPHGWSRGSSYCPPPSRIRTHSLTNYRDRTDRYRSLDRDWSSNVRATPPARDQRSGYGSRDQRSSGSSLGSYQSGSIGDRSGGSRDYSPQRSGSSPFGRDDRNSTRSASPSRGNLSVAVPPRTFSGRTDDRRTGDGSRTFERPTQQRSERAIPQRVERPTPQRVERPTPQRIERPVPQRPEAPRFDRGGGSGRSAPQQGGDERGRGRGVRGLGEG